jgi:UPF0755 protein
MKKRFDALIIILIPLVVFVLYIFWMPNWHDDLKGKIVTIPSGASFRTAVDSLVNAGVVRNKWAFQLAGRLLGYTKSVKKGKYLFASGRSNLDILRDINIGRSWLIIHVTIPEGWRIEKIAQRYRHDLGIDSEKIVSLCHNEKFIHGQGIGASSMEGYLLPETYSFYWQTDEQEILGRMLDGFKRFYTDSLLERQKHLNATQLEILTLASIVEAESSIDSDRPIIAGVYWNRLRKRMRLEADPTVQYALGEEKRLRFKDLNINSPYNTYRHRGLPPGPINNPGKFSILAALFPEQHGYLYFVATGTGGHYFARTYTDHQKNIRQYQRTRRELKRLSLRRTR